MKGSIFFRALDQKGLVLSTCGDFDGVEFSALSCDSRQVTKGTLFFVKGVAFKPEYLRSALESGAVAVVSEQKLCDDVPSLIVRDVRAAMPIAADLFYGHPSGKTSVVGVTGTKGKTTTTTMLKNIFDLSFHKKVGLTSTNGAYYGDEPLQKSGGSTPEALEFYGLMNTFAERGAKAVCAEISSQALEHHRVDGTEFSVGMCINLGADHISATEHASFEAYKEAKKSLFKMCHTGIFNRDDAYCDEFMQFATCEKKMTVGVDSEADITAKDILLAAGGSSFRVCGGAYDGQVFEVGIPGAFNVTNALFAIAAAEALGCPAEAVYEGIKKTTVEGRMEIFTEKGITVLTDYAHNEVSFEAVFSYIERFYPSSRVICLFGCQGNKALGRRVELPRSVGRHADFAILTSDDPENEEPRAIMDEVEIELKKTGVPYRMIEDREEAVKAAVAMAKPGDVLFLAGKGREITQKVRGKTVAYKGDVPTAREALSK